MRLNRSRSNNLRPKLKQSGLEQNKWEYPSFEEWVRTGSRLIRAYEHKIANALSEHMDQIRAEQVKAKQNTEKMPCHPIKCKSGWKTDGVILSIQAWSALAVCISSSATFRARLYRGILALKDENVLKVHHVTGGSKRTFCFDTINDCSCRYRIKISRVDYLNWYF